MPWKVSGVVEQRQQFVSQEYESGEWTMTELDASRIWHLAADRATPCLRLYGCKLASAGCRGTEPEHRDGIESDAGGDRSGGAGSSRRKHL